VKKDVFSRFDGTPACDGRTDRQAYFDSIVHAMHNITCYKLMLKTEVTWKKLTKN